MDGGKVINFYHNDEFTFLKKVCQDCLSRRYENEELHHFFKQIGLSE